ncbi:MAG: hypothetical protein NC236_01570 [Mycoplasma sp.]|nr:hypothetical protein [Mycoplasma sp.]
MSTRAKVWEKPNKFNRGNKSVQFIELMYDIIIVALVGASIDRVIYPLEHGLGFSYSSFFFITFELLTFFLIWKATNLYSARFEIPGYRHKTLILLQIVFISFSVVVTFLDVANVREDMTLLLINVIGISVPVLIIFYMYWSIRNVESFDKYEKEYLRKCWLFRLINFILLFSSFSILMIIFKILNVNIELEYILPIWIINLALWIYFDHLTKSKVLWANTSQLSINFLQERYGILYIVFIGEMFVEIMSSSIGDGVTNLSNKSIFFLIISIATMIFWWVFYDVYINAPELINHSKKISIFTSATLFIFLGLTYNIIGFALMIRGIEVYIGELIVCVGAFIYLSSFVATFSCLKNYTRTKMMIFQKHIRFLLNVSPFLQLSYFIPSLIYNISGEVFIISIFAMSLFIVLFPMFYNFILYNSKRFFRNKDFKNELDDFNKKDKEYVLKMIIPYIDKQHHEKYDYKLNSFSKYAKEQDEIRENTIK